MKPIKVLPAEIKQIYNNTFWNTNLTQIKHAQQI